MLHIVLSRLFLFDHAFKIRINIQPSIKNTSNTPTIMQAQIDPGLCNWDLTAFSLLLFKYLYLLILQGQTQIYSFWKFLLVPYL